jgi:hypothetical protein
MRKALLGILTLAFAALLVGCGGGGGGQTPAQATAEKEFEKLYRQYSARFYDKMTAPEAGALQPVEVTIEAAKMWDEVFGPHKDLMKRRIEEILKNLDTATPIQEDLYVDVTPPGERLEPTADQPQGIVLKQFLWSPVGSAQMGLNSWLARVLNPQQFALRSVMTSNAGLFWEAVDRNLDHPKLELRQGSSIFIVELSRKDDYYLADKIRWLKPKAIGATGPTVPAVSPTTPAVTPTTPAKSPDKTTKSPDKTTKTSGPKG